MRRQVFIATPVVIVAVAAYLAGPAAAAEIDGDSRIDSVIVYPDGATVTRIVKADAAAGDNTIVLRDFPVSLDPASLRIEGEGDGKLTIGAIDAASPKLLPPANLPEIDRRIETLRDQRAALDGAIAGAQARRQFAERFATTAPAGLGDKGEARPLAEWREAFSAVAEEVTAAKAAVREAKIRQRDIDREIARLENERRANPPRKLELRIGLAAAAPTSTTLRVTYSVRGARWIPFYDARLETAAKPGTKGAKPSLELVRRAEVAQATGEDWNDVALTLSTIRTARGGNAPELKSLIAHYRVPAPPPVAMQSFQRDAAAPTAPSARAKTEAQEQEAAFDASGFQAVFRVPGRVSIVAQQSAKSFRLATATIAPELSVRAVPALDQSAFLEASFKNADEAPLLPGRVAIYRDGLFVGRSSMALTPKDETVQLGFGADDQIKVTRVLVRKLAGSAGLIGSSKIEEREFKTTVRNGHGFPVKVGIEDQIPVSEADDIAVEMLPATTQPTARDLHNRRGVLEWTFDTAPGEARDITLAWRVRWPKDKSMVLTPVMD